MSFKDYDTNQLWRLYLTLINIIVFLIIIAFMYLLLEDHIAEYMNQPQYTQEQLDKISKRRSIARGQERNDNYDLIENGIHVKTGLKSDENLQLVIGSCTSCHSAKLITQNRATRQGWESMIDWMYKTQGLPNLGDREPKIVDYLVKNYAPQEVGRRKNLDIDAIEWYILNVDGE